MEPQPAIPAPQLELGTHVKYWQKPNGEWARTVDAISPREREILSAFTADDLELLKRNPLSAMGFPATIEIRGEQINGAYMPVSGMGSVHVATKRSRASFGNGWKPGAFGDGASWSVSGAAATAEEAVKRTLIHEFGHHVHIIMGEPSDSVVNAAYASAMANRTAITAYATSNAKEYFAESFAAYRYYPDDLRRIDPGAFAMVEEVLRLHRTLPSKSEVVLSQ